MTHITQAEFAQIKFLVSKQKLPYTAIGSRVFSSPNYSVCGHCTPEEAIFIAMACNLTWGLCEMVDELQARAESAEQERDKLRAALEHAESHIQEMENAEGRAFFADTAAMAKQLGDTMQERDALAERVKALESQFCPTCKHHWSLHRDICHERIGTESGIWVYCDCAERENDHA